MQVMKLGISYVTNNLTLKIYIYIYIYIYIFFFFKIRKISIFMKEIYLQRWLYSRLLKL